MKVEVIRVKADFSSRLFGPAVGAGLTEAAEIYQHALIAKIDNTGTGKRYSSRRGDGTTHTASAPGKPISKDTGEMSESIEIHRPGQNEVEIGFEGDHALIMRELEYGTIIGGRNPIRQNPQAIEARPTMYPTYTETKDLIVAAVRNSIVEAFK